MKGRTYRYYEGDVMYPFGFGLSYTSFDYQWGRQPVTQRSVNDSIVFSVQVKNTGPMDGDEVTQIYLQYPAVERMPLKELKAFKRIHVKKGQVNSIRFAIPLTELQKWDIKQGRWLLYPGNYKIWRRPAASPGRSSPPARP